MTPAAIGSVTPTPSPTEFLYSVKDGDTLGAIADEFGVSVESLMQANSITDPTTLHVGDVPIIPGVKVTPLPSRTPPPSTTSRTPDWHILSLPLAGSCHYDTHHADAPRESARRS